MMTVYVVQCLESGSSYIVGIYATEDAAADVLRDLRATGSLQATYVCDQYVVTGMEDASA